MTYRIFNESSKLVKIAVPLFIVITGLLAFAFKGTIAAAENEQTCQQTELSTMELTYLGYNP